MGKTAAELKAELQTRMDASDSQKMQQAEDAERQAAALSAKPGEITGGEVGNLEQDRLLENELSRNQDIQRAEKLQLEKSRREQEEQDRADEERARQAATNELLAEREKNPPSGVSATTPAAFNPPLRVDPVPAAAAEFPIEAGFREFEHLYAGANTILPKGKKLVFGGPLGHPGRFITRVEEEITHLAELANTPGSMVREVKKDVDGRTVVVEDRILRADQQAALTTSRENSARDLDPIASAAMTNLPRVIAQTSS